MPDQTVVADAPPRPTGARTDRPSASTRRRWERLAALETAVADARLQGHDDGWRSGWRSGVATGAVCGALAASLAWAAWLTAAAPAAAPFTRPTSAAHATEPGA